MSFDQQYQGWTFYTSDAYHGAHRLFVAVPCVVQGALIPAEGLLDTAAEWCVIPGDLARHLFAEGSGEGSVRLETRLGSFSGQLERRLVRFPAVEGDDLEIEATWFVSPDWPGPLVLGWKGCLERLRFALDPGEARFYFGE